MTKLQFHHLDVLPFNNKSEKSITSSSDEIMNSAINIEKPITIKLYKTVNNYSIEN